MTVDVLRLMLPMPHSCFFFYYDGNGVGWCFLLSWLYVNLSSFHYLSLADSQELKTSMGCLCRILQTSQCTSQMFQGIFFIALVWLTYSPNIFTPVKPRQHSHIHLRNLFCLCSHPANLPLVWHQQKRAQSVFKFDLILHRLWLSYIYACHHSCS